MGTCTCNVKLDCFSTAVSKAMKQMNLKVAFATGIALGTFLSLLRHNCDLYDLEQRVSNLEEGACRMGNG